MEIQSILRDRQNSLSYLRLGQRCEIETEPPPETIALAKKKGIYYTPKEITTYICFQTLNSYLLHYLGKSTLDISKYINQSSTEELFNLFQLLGTLKVLDPACGAGAFLIEMAEMLFQLKTSIQKKLNNFFSDFELKKSILLNNIYGVDFFEDAIEQTKTNLLKWLNLGANSSDNQRSQPLLDCNLRVGNSLIGWLDEAIDPIQINSGIIDAIFGKITEKQRELLINQLKESRPLHWKVDFGEIMSKGGFDLIIGNPPYIFVRGMNFSSFENSFYREKFLMDYQSLAKGKAQQSRKINSFSLFIMRSLSLLKDNCFLGFIVPNTLLRTTTNDSIRQFILQKAFIQEITDLEGGIFKGITAATILIFLQKRSNSTDLTLINYNVRDLLNFQFESHYLNQTIFAKNPVLAFNIHLDSEFESLFHLMKQNTVELGQLTNEIIEGIVCRKSDNLFTDDKSHPLAKKLLRGKDIDRYQIKWKSNQYIIYATDTTLTKTKLHRPRPQWVHEAPEKLLTQRIGGGVFPLRVAYDNSQYYTFASINNIILKKPLLFENKTFLSKYILAILNSKLLNAYYLLNFSNKSALTVNISKTYLESLPIKECPLEIQNSISTLVDYLLFLNSTEVEKTAEHTQLCKFIDSYLLDSLIYAIYFPDSLKTDLCRLTSDHIFPLPDSSSKEAKINFLSDFCHKLQDNSLITQAIEKIRNQEIILKVEALLQTRGNLTF